MRYLQYDTTNNAYGHYHSFWRRSSLLQLPQRVKNREIEKLRRDTKTSSEVYGSFYHMPFDRWTNPNLNLSSPPHADEDQWDQDRGKEAYGNNNNENYVTQKAFLPPIINPKTASYERHPPGSHSRYMEDTLRLPDIRAVDLQLTMNDSSRVTIHTVPKTPRTIYQSSYTG